MLWWVHLTTAAVALLLILTIVISHGFVDLKQPKNAVSSLRHRRGVVSVECKLSSNNSNDNNSKRTINNNINDNDNSMSYRMSAMPHHVAIKVCNITNAINFYSLLGFTVETKFITGPARAAWLIQNQQQQQYYYTQEKDEVDNNNNKHHQAAQVGFRIELIEVPSYMLQQQQQQQQQQRRHRAIDLMTHVTLLGLNHLALDVTYNCIQSQQRQQQQQQQQQELMGGEQSQYQLQEWIHDINTTSIKTYNKTIQYATPITTLHITKRIIGKQVYEIAFIYDADGTIIELVYYCGDISPPLNSNTTNPAMADGWEPWDGIGFVQ